MSCAAYQGEATSPSIEVNEYRNQARLISKVDHRSERVGPTSCAVYQGEATSPSIEVNEYRNKIGTTVVKLKR